MIVNVFVSDRDLADLVTFAHHMKPPVALGILAKVAMQGFQFSRPTISETRKYMANRGGQEEESALMPLWLGRGHLLSCVEHKVPLQWGQCAYDTIFQGATRVMTFLFQQSERIRSDLAIFRQKLEEPAADRKDLIDGSGRRIVGFGDLAGCR